MSIDLPESLAQVPLFHHLANEELREVYEAATVETFPDGENILEQGATCRNLWIVLEGKCDVVRRASTNGEAGGQGSDVVLATLAPFDNFGEMSFFQTAPHSAAVRARTKVTALKISREAYDGLIRGGSGAAFKLAYNTVESLAQRLRRMDEWVARLLSESAAPTPSGEWSGFRDKLFKEWTL